MPFHLVEKMMSLVFYFCTFIITAQGNGEEIFHSNLAWVPFEEPDENSEVYPITLREGTCTTTYKRESTCNLTPSCEDDFVPKMKTLVVADCTEGVHCKKVTAQVKIPSTGGNQNPKTFTYVIGCKPEEAQDSSRIFGGNALVIITAGIFFFIFFCMGRFIWVRHREFWVSFASRIFPWRAGVYNVNTIAGHSMTVQTSEVSSATQQADNGTRSPVVDNVPSIGEHPMIAQPSQDSAARSPDVDSVDTIAGHSNTAQPPEITSQMEDDAREVVYNRTTHMEQCNSAQTFKDESTSQREEDDSRDVNANCQMSDASPMTEAAMKFASKSDEVIRKP